MLSRKNKSKSNIYQVAAVVALTVVLVFLQASSGQPQVNQSNKQSFYISLTLLTGVSSAFHRPTRCIFLLVILQFFTKRGRSVVIAYTFAVAFTGPGLNLKNNMKILTNSIVCGEVTFM